jgi:acyl-CoA thioester hydrolase
MPRVKIELPATKKYTIELPIRIKDINYGNHLGHDALISLLHEARVSWLASNKYSEMQIDGAALIMADIMVSYKAEAFYGDILMVNIYIGEITKFGFEIFYEIACERNSNKILIALAKTGMICFDYETKKPIDVPNNFKLFLMG